MIVIAFHTADADDRMAGDLHTCQLRKSESAERVWVADFVWSHFEVFIVKLIATRLNLDLGDLFYIVTEI